MSLRKYATIQGEYGMWKPGDTIHFPTLNADTSWSLRYWRVVSYDAPCRRYRLRRISRLRSLWIWWRNQ